MYKYNYQSVHHNTDSNVLLCQVVYNHEFVTIIKQSQANSKSPMCVKCLMVYINAPDLWREFIMHARNVRRPRASHMSKGFTGQLSTWTIVHMTHAEEYWPREADIHIYQLMIILHNHILAVQT